MSGHTPGPWVATDNGHCWSVESPHHWVASTQFCFAQEQEANARLIAAAPDLLAMVEKYASECAECGGSGEVQPHQLARSSDHDRACTACADIRALIAKAVQP